MEPVTTFTTAWTVVKTASDITKKLNEVWKNLKDREAKHQVEEILDKVHELKQEAAALEDENRILREKLRFKGEDYEFRTPFWYDKAHPDRALCSKCFAENKAVPMGEPGQGCSSEYRLCLACGNSVEVGGRRPRPQPPVPGYGGKDWME
jgi:hypothetical protein